MYPRLALNLQSSCLRLGITSSHYGALIVAILGARWNAAAPPGCPHGPSAHLSCVTSLPAGLPPTAAVCPHSKHLPFWPLINPSISGCSVGCITKPKTNKPTKSCCNLPRIHFWNCRRTTLCELSNVEWPHQINASNTSKGTEPRPKSI